MSHEFDPYYQWLGIPPEEQPPNHYRLLGVNRFEPNPDVISRAADRQMTHLRTLQSGPHAAESQRLLNEVAAARGCLLNVDRKRAYDEQLKLQLVAKKPPVPSAAAPSPPKPPHATPSHITPPQMTPPARIPGAGLAAGGASKQRWQTVDSTEAATAGPVIDEPSGPPLPVLLAAGGAGATLLLLVGVVMWFALAGGDDTVAVAVTPENGTVAKRNNPASEYGPQDSLPSESENENTGTDEVESLFGSARLVLNWPESQRPGATLRIDGEAIDLNAAFVTRDPRFLVLPVDEGPHDVAIEWEDRSYFRRRFSVANYSPAKLTVIPTLPADVVVETGEEEMPEAEADSVISRLREGPSDPPAITPSQSVASPTTAAGIPEGPVLAFNFEPDTWFEADGKRKVRDLSGNNLHATLTTGELTDGPAGKAIKFNGDGYGLIPDDPRLRGGTEATISIAVWYLGAGAIVSKCQDNRRKDWSLVQNRELQFWGERDGNDFRSGVPCESGGQWMHAVVVLNLPQRQLKMFLDGRQMHSKNDVPNDASAATDAPVYLGASRYRDVSDVSDVTQLLSEISLDELLIYSRALSDEEIRGIYEHGKAGRTLAEGAEPSRNTLTESRQRRPRQLLVAAPSEQDLREAKRLVLEAYAVDLRDLATPAKKAGKLMAEIKNVENVVHRFAMLDQARAWAIDAEDVDLAMQAIDGMTENFRIDPLKLRASTLWAIARETSSSETKAVVAKAAGDLMYEAADADDFGTAEKLGKFAIETARKSRDYELIKQLVADARAVKTRHEKHEQFAKALETLKTDPEHPEANLIAGKYYCFDKGELDAGFPLLARGSDENLKKLADAELSRSFSTQERLRLGDGWWDLSEQQDEASASRSKQLATRHYLAIVASLTGLQKRRVQQRLAHAPKETLTADIENRSGDIGWLQIVSLGNSCVGIHGISPMVKDFDDSHLLRVHRLTKDLIRLESIKRPDSYLSVTDSGELEYLDGGDQPKSVFRVHASPLGNDPRMFCLEPTKTPGHLVCHKDGIIRLASSNIRDNLVSAVFCFKYASPKESIVSQTAGSLPPVYLLAQMKPVYRRIGWGSYKAGVSETPTDIGGRMAGSYIFLHANAVAVFVVPGNVRRFQSVAHVAHGDSNGVTYAVYCDGTKVYQSSRVKKDNPTMIDVSIPAHTNLLRIEVDQAGSGFCDHAYLLDPRLVGAKES